MERVEQPSAQQEYNRLEADISLPFAEVLRIFSNREKTLINEQVRRAIAVYRYSFEEYSKGSVVYAVSAAEECVEMPLFYPFNPEDRMVHLGVNLNAETAQALRDLGITDDGGDTHVLNNILNHYAHIKINVIENQRIITKKADGTAEELVII